jgi:hypothetical protein
MAEGSDNDLRDVIRQLRAIDNALFERRLHAVGSDERSRLRAESHAVSARIERCQGLLFDEATRDFTSELDEITSGTEEVREAIKSINDLNDALAGIAAVLRIVDTVIGLFGL